MDGGFERHQKFPVGCDDILRQADFPLRGTAEVEVGRAPFLDSDEQHRLAAVTAHRFQVRAHNARNLFQSLLQVAFGGWKRVALFGGEHALNSRWRDLVEAVVVQHAYAGKADGRLAAQQSVRNDEQQN
jgi:hypothetical protein